MRAQERGTLTRRVDKQIRVRKESNINSVNHQTSVLNEGERNEHRLLVTNRRKKITRTSTYIPFNK